MQVTKHLSINMELRCYLAQVGQLESHIAHNS